MTEGRALLIDDATLISPKVLAVVYPAMDGRRAIGVKAHRGETITATDGFYVAAGHNPGVHGAVLTEALASRFAAQIHVATDYDLATTLKIDPKAVRVARNLATRQSRRDRLNPQLRELPASNASPRPWDGRRSQSRGIAPRKTATSSPRPSPASTAAPWPRYPQPTDLTPPRHPSPGRSTAVDHLLPDPPPTPPRDHRGDQGDRRAPAVPDHRRGRGSCRPNSPRPPVIADREDLAVLVALARPVGPQVSFRPWPPSP